MPCSQLLLTSSLELLSLKQNDNSASFKYHQNTPISQEEREKASLLGHASFFSSEPQTGTTLVLLCPLTSGLVGLCYLFPCWSFYPACLGLSAAFIMCSFCCKAECWFPFLQPLSAGLTMCYSTHYNWTSFLSLFTWASYLLGGKDPSLPHHLG